MSIQHGPQARHTLRGRRCDREAPLSVGAFIFVLLTAAQTHAQNELAWCSEVIEGDLLGDEQSERVSLCARQAEWDGAELVVSIVRDGGPTLVVALNAPAPEERPETARVWIHGDRSGDSVGEFSYHVGGNAGCSGYGQLAMHGARWVYWPFYDPCGGDGMDGGPMGIGEFISLPSTHLPYPALRLDPNTGLVEWNGWETEFSSEEEQFQPTEASRARWNGESEQRAERALAQGNSYSAWRILDAADRWDADSRLGRRVTQACRREFTRAVGRIPNPLPEGMTDTTGFDREQVILYLAEMGLECSPGTPALVRPVERKVASEVALMRPFPEAMGDPRLASQRERARILGLNFGRIYRRARTAARNAIAEEERRAERAARQRANRERRNAEPCRQICNGDREGVTNQMQSAFASAVTECARRTVGSVEALRQNSRQRDACVMEGRVQCMFVCVDERNPNAP